MNRYSAKIFALFFVFTFLLSNAINAQGSAPDFMRSIGKIYVVVGVIAIIFIGIVLYLVRLDLKISKLEKIIKEHGED